MSAEKKSQITLRIPLVSEDLLRRIEEIGQSRRPRVGRNELILFILEEVAEGRLALPATLEPAAAAAA